MPSAMVLCPFRQPLWKSQWLILYLRNLLNSLYQDAMLP